jgi:hypothetical protein
MRIIAATVALGALMSSVEAAPIQLVCNGTLTSKGRGIIEVLAVSIDLSGKTVTLEQNGSAPITQIKDDEVTFAKPDFTSPALTGLLWGTINRIS